MVKISIIMPLFNAETYLEEALQSIQAQTFQEFEIICINDASTDDTTDILHRFQKIDNRIRIINNTERSGAAVSRNRGMHEAKGTYIAFLDGDDMFDKEMLELSYREIIKQDADMVMFEYIHVSSESIYEKKTVQRSHLFIEKYCMQPFSVQNFEPIEFMNWSCSPCNKLFKKSFLVSNELEFQTLPSANDMYFVTMALLLASKLIMLNDRRVMLYARDHNISTRISYDRDPMCTYWAMKKIGDDLVERGLFDKLFQYFYCIAFYNLRNTILNTKRRERAKQFYEFLQKEGVDNFVELSKECYKKTDIHIQNRMEKYKTLEFDSEWYKDEEILNFCLYKKEEKVLSFFQRYKSNNQRVVVWGVGKNGRILLDFLRTHHIRFVEVIDKDEKKQGTMINGYMIMKPDDCWQKAEVILATSFAVFSEVAGLSEGKNSSVIDIGEILEML